MYIDSHIHLTHGSFEGEVPCIDSQKNDVRIIHKTREDLISYMKEQGIMLCIEPGVDIDSNYKLLALNNRYPEYVYPAVGIHPTRSIETKWRNRHIIEELAKNEKVVAIGELGLDYHYERNKQHRFKQKCWFKWQLKLAHKCKLPLILHIRMADNDAVKILRHNKSILHGGVCHCFNGSAEIAKIYTEELGLMLGIGGSLLQNDCSDLEEAVMQTPLEYLILETDGPFVKAQRPDSISGKQWKRARNTSLIIPDVAKKIADLKEIDILEVEKVTTENVERLFKL